MQIFRGFSLGLQIWTAFLPPGAYVRVGEESKGKSKPAPISSPCRHKSLPLSSVSPWFFALASCKPCTSLSQPPPPGSEGSTTHGSIPTEPLPRCTKLSADGRLRSDTLPGLSLCHSESRPVRRSGASLSRGRNPRRDAERAGNPLHREPRPAAPGQGNP